MHHASFTHIHTVMDASKSSLRLHLAEGYLACRQAQPGIEPPTFQLVDDLLYHLSPQGGSIFSNTISILIIDLIGFKLHK